MNKFRIIFIAMVCFGIQAHAKVIKHPVKGAGPTPELGCLADDQVKNTYTPVELFKSAAVCANQDQQKQGVLLLFAAQAYGAFDMERVLDRTSYKVIQNLKSKSAASILPDKMRVMNEETEKSKKAASFCPALTKLGPPNYYPRYMILQGSRVSAGSGLNQSFDGRQAWAKILKSGNCIK